MGRNSYAGFNASGGGTYACVSQYPTVQTMQTGKLPEQPPLHSNRGGGHTVLDQEVDEQEYLSDDRTPIDRRNFFGENDSMYSVENSLDHSFDSYTRRNSQENESIDHSKIFQLRDDLTEGKPP